MWQDRMPLKAYNLQERAFLREQERLRQDLRPLKSHTIKMTANKIDISTYVHVPIISVVCAN